MQEQPVTTTPQSDNNAYRYANTKPLTVFALAAVAAIGALGMAWGAQSALENATDDAAIASPPDLKAVISAIEDRGEAIINLTAVDRSETDEGQRGFAGENADYDQPVDQSV